MLLLCFHEDPIKMRMEERRRGRFNMTPFGGHFHPARPGLRTVVLGSPHSGKKAVEDKMKGFPVRLLLFAEMRT